MEFAKEIFLTDYPAAEELLYVHRVQHSFPAQFLHWHKYFQVYYVLQGSFEHHMEDGSIVKMAAGDMFILPPGMQHRIASISQDTAYYSLSFFPTLLPTDLLGRQELDGFMAYLNLFRQHSKGSVHPKLTVPLQQQKLVERWIETIYNEFYSKDAGYISIIQGLLISIMSLFFRIYQTQPINRRHIGGFERNRANIGEAVRYLEEHFTEDLTSEDLAHRFAMSHTNFHKYFKTFTDLTFHRYLCRLRIEYAMQLMHTTELDITAIAYACGFSEYSSFYRNFTEYTGENPKSYIQKLHKF